MEEIAALQKEIAELQESLTEDAEDISARWEDLLDEITTFAVKPRRTDVRTDVVALAWVPSWEILDPASGSGQLEAWR